MAGATKGTVMELKSSRQHDHSQSPAYPPGQQGVASYRSYEDARQAVARLAEQDFPVARVSIVGHGLNFVEQVTGRRGFLASGLAGMANGAGIGALFGLVAGLFNWVDPLVSAFALGLYGLLLGAILGFLFGLISRAGAGLSSVGRMEADHFDVVADDEAAERARRALSTDAEVPLQ